MKTELATDIRTIIHIITKSEVGGAQTWVYNLCKLFPEYNHVLITSEEGWLTNKNVFKEVHILKGLTSYSDFLLPFKLNRIISKYTDEALIISSSAHAGLYSRLAQIGSKQKPIYVSHGWSCLYQKSLLRHIFINIERFLAYQSLAILCVSEADRDLAINIIKIPKDKTVLIKNKTFPLDFISHTKVIDKHDYKLNLLFLARLAAPKRLDLLIDVIDNLELNVVLHVVGDGELRQALEDKADPNKVVFYGNVENFNDFSSLDGFCLISDSEGLPMSAIEAAYHGLPLLLSNVGGCRELISDNGVLTTNNVPDLEKSLALFCENILEFKKSAESIKHNFDMSKSRSEYEILFDYR